MIPRYQQILFVAFLVATILMGLELVHLRHSSRDRLAASIADAPLVEPSQVPLDSVKLLLASDVDDSLRLIEKRLPAPTSPNARARYVLQALFTEYSSPLSQHTLPSGGSVEDVFLLPIAMPATTLPASKQPLIAIVNLERSFAETHPSGLTSEMLTVRSMVGTLHANLPQIAAVRFLVDGVQVDTLAGHADLRHVYSATEERQIQIDNELAGMTP